MFCCGLSVVTAAVLFFNSCLGDEITSAVHTGWLLQPYKGCVAERIGTGCPAEAMVNIFAWDWIDSALLHHLRRVSTAYAGVLLDTEGSMKWLRQKKQA